MTDTTLTTVLLNDFLNGGLVERGLRLHRIQTRVLHFTRDEVALGYLNFLLRDVAAQLYNFHTIEQGLGDGAQIIGRSNEEHLREVVVHIEIVVVEGSILLRV